MGKNILLQEMVGWGTGALHPAPGHFFYDPDCLRT